MNKQDAIELAKRGTKITHWRFKRHEFVVIPEGGFNLENENKEEQRMDFWEIRKEGVWEEDWEVWKQKTPGV